LRKSSDLRRHRRSPNMSNADRRQRNRRPSGAARAGCERNQNCGGRSYARIKKHGRWLRYFFATTM
jgi:hypothetical protein